MKVGEKKKAVVINCKVISKFSNGFDVDFQLMGDENTYHGRLYENHGQVGKYSTAVFMEAGFEKYSDDSHNDVTDQIGEQVVSYLKTSESQV